MIAHPAVNDLADRDKPETKEIKSAIRQLRSSLAQANYQFAEIFICTPYFNFPKSIHREVKRAMKRGVKVTIVVGDKTANDFYISPEEDFKTIGGLPYLYEVNLRR